MGIVLVAPAAVAAAPTSGTIGGALFSFFSQVAVSVALSYVAGALQPKNKWNNSEGQAGEKVTTSNDGASAEMVTLGQDRVSGSLVYWTEHPASNDDDMATLIVALGELPDIDVADTQYEGPVKELVGEKTLIYGTDLVPFTGQYNNGTGSFQLDAKDWVPPIGDGYHGDIWWRSDTEELWIKKGTRWLHKYGPGFSRVFHAASLPDPNVGGLYQYADFMVVGNQVYRADITQGYGSSDGAGLGTQFVWRAFAKTNTRDPFQWHDNKTVAPTEGGEHAHWNERAGRYDWHLKVRFYDGTQTEADEYVQAIVAEDGHPEKWEENHIGYRRVYKVVTYRYLPDIYGNVYPPTTATILKGMRIYDPRLPASGGDRAWFGETVKAGQIQWTDNAAICAAFLKLWPALPGAAHRYTDLNETDLIASADISDEVVQEEPRYTINGSVKNNAPRMDVEEDAEIALGGEIVYDQKVRILAGAPVDLGTVPVITSEDIFPVYSQRPWVETRQRVNEVDATFFAPGLNYIQSTTGPLSEDKTAEGGETIADTLSLPFAGRGRKTARAQARIWLRKKQLHFRQTVMVDAAKGMDFGLTGVVKLDTVDGEPGQPITGFDNKAFSIQKIVFPLLPAVSDQGNTIFGCALDLLEYDLDTWDRPGEPTTEDNEDDLRLRPTKVSMPTISAIKEVGEPYTGHNGMLLTDLGVRLDAPDHGLWDRLELQWRLMEEANLYEGSALGDDPADFVDELAWHTSTWEPKNRKDPYKKISGIRLGAWYEYRARARHAITGAWSDDYDDVEWGNETIYKVPEKPGYVSKDALSIHRNPFFDQSRVHPGALYADGWEDVSDAGAGIRILEVNDIEQKGTTNRVARLFGDAGSNARLRMTAKDAPTVFPGELLFISVGVTSRNIGYPYEGDFYGGVFTEWLRDDKSLINREEDEGSGAGPIRDETTSSSLVDDEYNVGTFGYERDFDGGAHNVTFTVSKILAVPHYRSLSKLRIVIKLFPFGQDANCDIDHCTVSRVQVLTAIPNASNSVEVPGAWTDYLYFGGNRVGNVPKEYRAYARLYAQVRVLSNGASFPLSAHLRLQQFLESAGETGTIDTDPLTQDLLIYDSDYDGAPDESDLELVNWAAAGDENNAWQTILAEGEILNYAHEIPNWVQCDYPTSQSVDFSDAAWTLSGVTINPTFAQAIDGTGTANQMLETSGAGDLVHSIVRSRDVTAGKLYGVSLAVRVLGQVNECVRLQISGGGHPTVNVEFDVANLEWLGGLNFVRRDYIKHASAWFTAWFTFIATATTTVTMSYSMKPTAEDDWSYDAGAGGNGLLVWAGQFLREVGGPPQIDRKGVKVQVTSNRSSPIVEMRNAELTYVQRRKGGAS